MPWLLITISAYFLNAVAIVTDKFLLTKKFDNPAVYTFYVAFLGLLVLLFLPFGYTLPAAEHLIFAAASGASFTAALFFLFKALNQGDASRIGPAVGGISPLFTLVFAFWLLGERLTGQELVGVFYLIFGTIALVFASERAFRLNIWWTTALASACFAFSYVCAKVVYTDLNFTTGFVLIRLSAAVAALFLLLSPTNRRSIVNSFYQSQSGRLGLFIFGQSAGASSAILLNYAISLANVTIINALQGLQFVFLLILTFLFSRFAPRILSEEFSGRPLILKIIAMILISVGLIFII